MKIKPRPPVVISALSGKTPDEVVKLPQSLIYEMAKQQIRRDAEERAKRMREWNKRLNVHFY